MELELFGTVGCCVAPCQCHGIGHEGADRLDLGGDLVIPVEMLGIMTWWQDATEQPGFKH